MDTGNLQSALNDFFTAFTNEHSIIIITFLLVSFLIGLFFGWWQGRRGKRKLRKDLKQKESELIRVQAEYNAVQEQLGLKEADLTKANLAVEELKTEVSRVEHEKAQMRSALDESNTNFENLKIANQTQLSDIEALNEEIVKLESSNSQQAEQLENTTANTVDVDLSKVQSNYDHANLRLAAIEEKLSRMERENSSLKSEIAGMKDSSIISFVDDEPSDNDEEIVIEDVEARPEDMEFVSKEERSILARQKIKAAFGDRIVIASPNEKDDLKKINGVGTFIEQKLNDIGIYTFKQISQFDAELIQQVTDAIEFFPGRIKRDDWVGQAKKLS